MEPFVDNFVPSGGSVDYFVGRDCKLRCIGCSPNYSSGWADVHKKLGLGIPEPLPPRPRLSEILAGDPNIHRVRLTGGEPLLSSTLPIDLLSSERLSELTLVIFTNAVTQPSKEWLEVWARARRVELHFSIYGLGPLNEYLRYPSKWSDVEEFLATAWAQYRQHSSFRLRLRCEVSALNIGRLSEILAWWKGEWDKNALRAFSRETDITFLSSIGLDFTRIEALPMPLRPQMHADLLNLGAEGVELSKVLKVRWSPAKSVQLTRHLMEIDKVRGTSLARVRPELALEFGRVHREKRTMINSTFCALPWLHVRHMQTSKTQPCCSFEFVPQPMEGKTLSDVLEGEFFSDIREKMLKGEKVEGCKRCYEREAGNGRSMRTDANEFNIDEWDEKPALRYVELYLGNLCNLKCRGCRSSSSTKWIQDEIQLGIWHERIAKPHRTNLQVLDGAWDTVTKIKLIGGEPLIIPEHEELLRTLSERRDLREITIEYTTNATVRVSPFILECWSKLSAVAISFSVDGLKRTNDSFREGSRWEDVVENIRWFTKNCSWSNSRFCIHTVVNIYNVHEIVELDDFLVSEFHGFDMTKDCLFEPGWLDARNLPEDELQTLIAHYREAATRFADFPKRRTAYTYIANFLSLPFARDFENFLENDEKLNDLRGYRLKDIHPRLYELSLQARASKTRVETQELSL